MSNRPSHYGQSNDSHTRVPDIHRRSYPPTHQRGRGGGAVRNRNQRRSFNNNDSDRNTRRWSGPYKRNSNESMNSTTSSINNNANSSSTEEKTPYRQPKPLIISPSSNNKTNNETPQPQNPSTLPLLDPNDPASARRIHQRRRQILFGKNTAGYEAYTQQIPKCQRRKYSIEHPSTPDYNLDISVKRWQGLVNAWRRALHAFDPPDLVVKKGDEGITLAPRPFMSRQEEEVEQAKANGLQVAFGSMAVGKGFGVKVGESEVDVKRGEEVLEEEEAYRTSCVWNEEEGEKDFLEEEVGYDSDEDIL